jgi:hypothetical protein
VKPIEIPRRASVCALGQEPLQEGSVYYSMLEEGDGLQRKDYCSACWNQVRSDSNPRAFWKSKVLPKVSSQKRQVVDFSRYAFILLKEALETGIEEEAFVLALYLARKKQLFLRNEMERAPGERYSLYEVAETEEMLAVKKFDLTNFQADKVQDNLARKFSSKNE